MNLDLTGKRIVITGATSGIGQTTAKMAARAGADIAFCGITEEGASDTIAAIEQAGRRAFFRAFDVADQDATRQFGRDAIAFLGGIDGLFNNAGAAFTWGVAATDREKLDRCLAVNFYAAWALAQEAYPHMKAAGGGVIVNVASVHARHTIPGMFPYNVSKAMMVALTQSIAIEWGRDNIQCVAVAPGLIMTAAVDAFMAQQPDPAGTLQRFSDSYPLGHGGRTEDVASLVVYLFSGVNRFISGTTVFVDGGLGALDPEARYE